MMHVHDKQSYFIWNSGISRFKIRCWTEVVFSVFRRVGARVRRAWEARVRDARERRAWEAHVRGARERRVWRVHERQVRRQWRSGNSSHAPPLAHSPLTLSSRFSQTFLALASARLKHKKNRRLLRSIQQRNEPYSKTVFTKLTLSAAIIIRVTFSLPDSLKMSASTRITALFL